ncbi:Holliday junction resolvase RuvX [Propioniciclava tarda]|uniref:Putative pre-16S rRNA nuclease n=1 Tax=Propioniciclava tarda TaxID=433330 RepID=A0A4Q9KMV6_PROTD|nr:Holliday junction resolvase RuvX [Propioniciclava tarda]TBT95863.1 Holliday junction resolvase RuvX [Propioniciclava tarda]SMO40710.1 putative holliday junction resolvase [Propioniciclava tarda]
MTDAAGAGFRVGVRLALDWGQARIGVAACDAHGTLAYPVETIASASDLSAVKAKLQRIVAEYDPMEIVLGLPRHLKGVEGAAAAGVREKAAWVAALFPSVGVRLVDERLTTVSAAANLRSAGRSAKQQRSVIDQAAAVAILDHALDVERHTGRAAGEQVSERTPS